MGNRSEVLSLLAGAVWSEESSYISEIAKGLGFPLLAKVSRGQYLGLGQSSFSPSQVSHILLLSAGHSPSLVAQCVKFKSGQRRVTPYGPTLVIPQDFQGHFEILNEEGRAVPSIENVESLAKRFPDSCLVREPFKAHKADIPKNLEDKVPLNPAYRIGEKTRVVLAGEILVLVGEVSVPSAKGKVTKYLRCFDQKGQTLFLPSSGKGRFSPLARQESISGVHTTKSILSKRLPLMVRVVEGKAPVGSSKFKFVPELRLYSCLNEELLFALPLSQSWKDTLVPLPLTVPLKFQVCRNMAHLEATKEFARLQDRANLLLNLAKNHIQIYDINLKKELRFDGRQWKAYAPPLFLTPTPTSPIPDLDLKPHVKETPIPDEEEYEDIDQIYDYVRGIKPVPSRLSGGGPKTTLVTITSSGPDVIANVTHPPICLPNSLDKREPDFPVPKPKHKPTHSYPQVTSHMDKVDKRPTPPPIETIPSLQKGFEGFEYRKSIRNSQGLSVSVVNNNRRNSHHLNPEAKVHNHKVHEGTQIQIQIRSSEAISRSQDILIRTNHQEKTRLDSTGGSVSTETTPTNTSGSSSASSNSKGKPRTQLYIKHTKAEPPPSPGEFSLSGSPSNRLLFRRSPIFDCRYKSMNDLLTSSQRLKEPLPPLPTHQHHHSHTNLYLGGCGGSQNMLHVLGRSSGLFRPKSLTNIALEDGLSRPLVFGGSGGGGMGGVKKKLAEMVVPSHQHKSSSQRTPTRQYRKASLQHSSLFL